MKLHDRKKLLQALSETLHKNLITAGMDKVDVRVPLRTMRKPDHQSMAMYDIRMPLSPVDVWDLDATWPLSALYEFTSPMDDFMNELEQMDAFRGMADEFNAALNMQNRFANMGTTNLTGVEVFAVVGTTITILAGAKMVYDYYSSESAGDTDFRNKYNLDPHGDLDGNGVDNVHDADIDGDGVLNEDDKYPSDPEHSFMAMDRDGDGIPDDMDEFPDDPNSGVMSIAFSALGMPRGGADVSFRVTLGLTEDGIASRVEGTDGSITQINAVISSSP